MSVPDRRLKGEGKVSRANAGFGRFVEKFSSKSASLGLGKVLVVLRPWVLSAAVAGLVPFGCGTPTASLVISAPSTVIAGSSFTVTVTAMAGGSRDRVINSAIHFTSSDTAVVLPLDYQFAATDAGSHTFVNAFTLMTPGSQSITATVTTSSVINGTAHVTVTAATPAMQSSIAP
jgi:hypothetical protein